MHEQREVKALTTAFIFEDSSTDSKVRTILNMNGIVSEKKNVYLPLKKKPIVSIQILFTGL